MGRRSSRSTDLLTWPHRIPTMERFHKTRTVSDNTKQLQEAKNVSDNTRQFLKARTVSEMTEPV